MDLSKIPIIPQQQQIPPSTTPTNPLYHRNIVINGLPPISIKKSVVTEGLATSERIPTSTWGPFTIIVVVFLVILTCFILNCSRILRSVNERRMDRLGRSGPFKQKSFERRHKELQEADLEWNNHPPMVYEDKIVATPESIHCSKHSSLSSSGWSSYSTLEVAQSHHYNDINFIKNQPPGVQLRLTLENASSSSLVVEPNQAVITSSTVSSKSSKSSSSIQRPLILPQQLNNSNNTTTSSSSHSTVTTTITNENLPNSSSLPLIHNNTIKTLTSSPSL